MRAFAQSIRIEFVKSLCLGTIIRSLGVSSAIGMFLVGKVSINQYALGSITIKQYAILSRLIAKSRC